MSNLLTYDNLGEIEAAFTQHFPEVPREQGCLVWAGLTVQFIKKRIPRVTPALVGGSAFFPLCRDPENVPEPAPTEVGFLWGDEFSNMLAAAAGVNPEFHAWVMVLDGPMSLYNPLCIDLSAHYVPLHFTDLIKTQGGTWDPACHPPRGFQAHARSLMGGPGRMLYAPNPAATQFVRTKWNEALADKALSGLF